MAQRSEALERVVPTANVSLVGLVKAWPMIVWGFDGIASDQQDQRCGHFDHGLYYMLCTRRARVAQIVKCVVRIPGITHAIGRNINARSMELI